MSHPFGDLVSQHLHRKHGLSQAKLAEGILQDPSIIGKMCKGDRIAVRLGGLAYLLSGRLYKSNRLFSGEQRTLHYASHAEYPRLGARQCSVL